MINFCSKCGVNVQQGTAFCSGCGVSLNTKTAEKSVSEELVHSTESMINFNFPVQAQTQELASRTSRLLAAMIDFFVLLVPLIIPVFGLVWFVFYGLCQDVIPYLNGQSFGKKIMGIRVVDRESFKPITGKYDVGAIRELPRFIPIFGLIDALFIFGSDKRRIGDRWAKTIVIASA